MIQVQPIENKDEQKALCALCRADFLPDALAYRALDDAGNVTGICQFFLDDKGGHITHIAAPQGKDDADTLFLLGRSALNFMDLCGAKTAFFEGDGLSRELLLRIGFTTKTEIPSVSLEGFFTHPCQHHAH